MVLVKVGEGLSIYLDLLIGVNIIVNYFLLRLTLKITSCDSKNGRVILSASVGSLSSLYIFVLLDSIIIDLVVKLFFSAVMILIAVGFINIKAFLRNISVLFAVSFLYAGGMLAAWALFKWDTIIINNSTVYLNISPITLIAFSAVFYFLFIIIKSLLKRNAVKAMRCRVKLHFQNKTVELIGIFDTGNSVKDLFSDSQVIFIGEKNAVEFLNGKPSEFQNNYRLLPCSTVTGSKLLEAVRIDSARVFAENKEITLLKPILAISDMPIDEEYSLILNPEILNKSEENYVAFKNS